MTASELTVGIAELKIVDNSKVLICQALGSCVAIILYEPNLKIGALAHIVLPDSKKIGKKGNNPAKFADTAIRDMIRSLKKKGVAKQRLVAKLVGGAHMFKMKDSFGNDIGAANVMVAKTILNYEGIEIVSEDTGGDYGRTVRFYTGSGRVKISSKKEEKEI